MTSPPDPNPADSGATLDTPVGSDGTEGAAGVRRVNPLTWARSTPMLYPDEYTWFVFVSAMDIMLTWAILQRNGTEVNPVARVIIDRWDLPGAIVFKFSLMLFVIGVCEFIGRQGRSARWLAWTAVTISAMPVVYSLFLLLVHSWYPEAFTGVPAG